MISSLEAPKAVGGDDASLWEAETWVPEAHNRLTIQLQIVVNIPEASQ
jgi:hypothetical protein